MTRVSCPRTQHNGLGQNSISLFEIPRAMPWATAPRGENGALDLRRKFLQNIDSCRLWRKQPDLPKIYFRVPKKHRVKYFFKNTSMKSINVQCSGQVFHRKQRKSVRWKRLILIMELRKAVSGIIISEKNFCASISQCHFTHKSFKKQVVNLRASVLNGSIIISVPRVYKNTN